MKKEDIQKLIKKATPLELELVWIPRIMERQTSDEIQSEMTKEHNNVGLNGVDAPFITRIYNDIQAGKHLTDNQADSVKRVLIKYANQFLNMMEEKKEIIPEEKKPRIPDYEERLDQLFLATFETNHPAMLDWVSIKMELKRLRK